MDPGRQVEPAVRKPWDAPAGPLGRLDRKHRSSVSKTADPTPSQIHPSRKARRTDPILHHRPITILSPTGADTLAFQSCVPAP